MLVVAVVVAVFLASHKAPWPTHPVFGQLHRLSLDGKGKERKGKKKDAPGKIFWWVGVCVKKKRPCPLEKKRKQQKPPLTKK